MFSRAYAQMATCSPSRTSLMTGLRPDTATITDQKTHFRSSVPTVVTLPQYFKQNGYRTQGICKVYNDGLDDSESWTEPYQDAFGPSRPYGPDGKQLAYAAVDAPYGKFSDYKCASLAINAIWNSRDKPFFIAVGFKKPHLPFLAPPEFFAMYDKYSLPEAINPFRALNAPSFAFDNGAELRAFSEMPANTADYSEDLRRNLKRGYYAATSFVDSQVTRVLDELNAAGLSDNTIVVLFGDHGWHLGEQREWGKHTNFEIGTRVPLIIRAPGRSGNRSSNALVELVDLYPTLVELAGLPMPTPNQHGGYALEGDSLVGFIDNPLRSGTRGAFSQWVRGGYLGHSVRTDRWRFTQWVNSKGIKQYELYDHVLDSDETVNVAGDSQYQATIELLMSALSAGGQVDLPPELQ